MNDPRHAHDRARSPRSVAVLEAISARSCDVFFCASKALIAETCPEVSRIFRGIKASSRDRGA